MKAANWSELVMAVVSLAGAAGAWLRADAARRRAEAAARQVTAHIAAHRQAAGNGRGNGQ